ncbi:hypothetical protein PAMP_020511 [Pampus punctatissimus]
MTLEQPVVFNLMGSPVFYQLMIFMISFVSTLFCGHSGKTELTAVSLAAATYGSGNLKRVGVILLLACFPCWAILIYTEQSPEVTRCTFR